MTTARHAALALAWKRLFDALIAIVGLLVLSPLLLCVALGIVLSLGRPVLFTQERPGLGGRPFRLRKFRTMRDARDCDGRLLPDGERLTRLGRFLRSSSIDELPELWNVLIGDMSLVGPRPWLMEYLPHYTPEQRRRHEVRPGITGWAQIHGRNASSWDERLRLDVWYVDNCNPLLDIKILLKTLATVVRREGISAAGHATMPRFDAVPRPAAEESLPATPASFPPPPTSPASPASGTDNSAQNPGK